MTIISARARAKLEQQTDTTSISIELDSNTIDELRHCWLDPVYFINTYVGQMSEQMEGFVDTALKTKGVICKHDRQVGITTTSLAYLLWDAMFNSDRKILAVFPTHAMRMYALSRFKDLYEALPLVMDCELARVNQDTIEFVNGSSIKFQVATRTTGVGSSFDVLYLGDFGMVNEQIAQDLWYSLIPTLVSKNSKIICHSNPTTSSHVFARLYQAASSGRDNWVALDIHAI